MYLDCTIKIPDSNGKITKKTIKGTTYIYYEYARIYLKDKKYNTPRRICIGKQIPGQPALMLPNDKFLKIFPQEILPEEKQGYRSGCLRIGAYIVIRNGNSSSMPSGMFIKPSSSGAGSGPLSFPSANSNRFAITSAVLMVLPVSSSL